MNFLLLMVSYVWVKATIKIILLHLVTKSLSSNLTFLCSYEPNTFTALTLPKITTSISLVSALHSCTFQ